MPKVLVAAAGALLEQLSKLVKGSLNCGVNALGFRFITGFRTMPGEEKSVQAPGSLMATVA